MCRSAQPRLGSAASRWVQICTAMLRHIHLFLMHARTTSTLGRFLEIAQHCDCGSAVCEVLYGEGPTPDQMSVQPQVILMCAYCCGRVCSRLPLGRIAAVLMLLPALTKTRTTALMLTRPSGRWRLMTRAWRRQLVLALSCGKVG